MAHTPDCSSTYSSSDDEGPTTPIVIRSRPTFVGKLVALDLNRKLESLNVKSKLEKDMDVLATEAGVQLLHVRGRLGESHSTTVYEVADEQARLYAVKYTELDLLPFGQRDMALNEPEYLRRTSSPYIVKLHASLQTDTHLILLLEHGCGDLSTMREPMSDVMITKSVVGLLDGLSAMFDAGLAHQDLKPANLLRTPTGLKIADLGLAFDLEDRTRRQYIGGSRAWSAPGA